MNSKDKVRFTFHKSERLTRKKYIQELFSKGSSFFLYPFKVLYLEHSYSDIPPTQVLFSVSKRLFKNASDRNTIKRKIREAYRLNKHLIINKSSEPANLLIAYIYVGKSIHSSQEIESSLVKTIKRLKKSISQ